MESGLLSSCKGPLGIALESLQGNRASSVIGGKSRDVFLVMGGSFRFLSSCDEDLRVLLTLPQRNEVSLEFRWAPRDSSQVTAGK